MADRVRYADLDIATRFAGVRNLIAEEGADLDRRIELFLTGLFPNPDIEMIVGDPDPERRRQRTRQLQREAYRRRTRQAAA